MLFRLNFSCYSCLLIQLKNKMIQAIIDIFYEIRKVRWTEIFIRFFLLFIFMQMELWKPFERVLHVEEMWQYKNPRTKDYVSAKWLFYFIIPFPMVLFTVIYFIKRDKHDFMAGNLAYSLSIGINGFITDAVKVAVGRPRPDFYYRCYPDGKMTENLSCTNPNLYDVMQGRKSFPSGHASFAFLSFSFVAFYFMGKLNVFNERGRGNGTKLAFCLSPLIVATFVAISRTCDYHHHYTDVLAGSVLGLLVSYLCYRQYYPSLDSRTSAKAFALRWNEKEIDNTQKTSDDSNSESEAQAMLENKTTSSYRT